MRKFSHLPKFVSLIIILFITLEVSAQHQRRLSAQEKRQQLQQESSAAMTEVDNTYKEILSLVNSGQTPPDPNLKESLRVIARNRKYLPVLNNLQKSTYHILSAWVYYFDDKQDRALKQAVSGQKVAPKNINTIKTHFALAIIYKDYTSAIEALMEQDTNTRALPQSPETASVSYSQPAEDIQLDVNAVRIDMLGRAFDFHPEPVETDSTPWQSAGRLISALLWKIDANELDSFAPVDTNKPKDPNLPVQPAPKPVAAQSEENLPPQTEFEQQSTAYGQAQISEFEEFSQLQSLFEKDERAVFVGINLNNPEKRKNLENWLSKHPKSWKTFTLSSEAQQKMISLFGGSNKPMLLIVGPDSAVRYAGDVNGFLPQMIIQNILKNPLEFMEPNEPNLPPKLSQTPVAEANEPAQTVLPSPAEPNRPPSSIVVKNVNEPNKLQTAPPSAASENQMDDGFSAADDYQAEKLLENARTFFRIGGTLPSHSYRDPVNWCRQIIKNYPNTKYAQEAQVLLRQVPEKYRQQYNITDEELGL